VTFGIERSRLDGSIDNLRGRRVPVTVPARPEQKNERKQTMNNTEKKNYIVPQATMVQLTLTNIIDTSTGGFLGDIDVFVEKATEEPDTKTV
jgi:hypothetical protein